MSTLLSNPASPERWTYVARTGYVTEHEDRFIGNLSRVRGSKMVCLSAHRTRPISDAGPGRWTAWALWVRLWTADRAGGEHFRPTSSYFAIHREEIPAFRHALALLEQGDFGEGATAVDPPAVPLTSEGGA